MRYVREIELRVRCSSRVDARCLLRARTTDRTYLDGARRAGEQPRDERVAVAARVAERREQQRREHDQQQREDAARVQRRLRRRRQHTTGSRAGGEG